MTAPEPRAQATTGHHVGLVLAVGAFTQYLTGRRWWSADEAPHLLKLLTDGQLGLTIAACTALAGAAYGELGARGVDADRAVAAAWAETGEAGQ